MTFLKPKKEIGRGNFGDPNLMLQDQSIAFLMLLTQIETLSKIIP